MSQRTIIVADYDPQWPEEFQVLKGIYQDKLGKMAADIQHVGSTSVPGLAAKPVLDIDIIIDPTNLQPVIDKLAELGYSHVGDLGIPGREAFKRASAKVPLDKEWKFSHNLYICVSGSISLENHLRFRNYLLVHPEAVKEYGHLKKELATKFPHDIDSYIDGKTEFITDILSKSGLDKDFIADIASQNKLPEH